MLPLDNYHLVGHRLVNDEHGFDRLELFLQRGRLTVHAATTFSLQDATSHG